MSENPEASHGVRSWARTSIGISVLVTRVMFASRPSLTTMQATENAVPPSTAPRVASLRLGAVLPSAVRKAASHSVQEPTWDSLEINQFVEAWVSSRAGSIAFPSASPPA